MKKALLTILALSVLLCSLVACGTKSSEAPDSEEQISVDSIVELFEKDYNAQKYTAEQISNLIPNLEANGISLNGSITAVVHLTKKASEPGRSDWSWAYVYEFTEEADAIALENNRRAFVEATEENGTCIRCGCIVVFGSSPIIASIEQ
ncbi:MAG: hypothetical protein IJZ08_00235 [Clostridia bacterium]|nr:hypothetical protein [Clostridia bacterium]